MDVYIALKASLKWAPIVGWVSTRSTRLHATASLSSFALHSFRWGTGLTNVVLQAMQIFDFLFLHRSWAADREYLARKLSDIGRRAEKSDEPLALFIFPEGTLVSSQTRPISKKYAEKMNIVRFDPSPSSRN